MRKIPFKGISEEDEFWSGATFRKEATTLNDPDPDDDFYEYVLFLDGGNNDYMLCAHVDEWEKGTVVSHVNITKGLNRCTVTAKEFKRSMILPGEIDSWFFIDHGTRETRKKHLISQYS